MPTAIKTPKVKPTPTKSVTDRAVKASKTATKPLASTEAPVIVSEIAVKTPANKKLITPNTKKAEISPSFVPYHTVSGEEYMSDAQLAHFKTLLLDWKEELVSEAESTKNYIQDESGTMPDINDRATQEEEFALALRTRDRERKLIRKIDKSLADMEAGDYGFCHTCGVEIGIRRLEARPTATQCIDCKTLAEMKEKQAWGHI